MEKLYTLFVGNINKDVTSKDLKLALESYGLLHQIQVPKIGKNCDSGYAYVKFLTFNHQKNIYEDRILINSRDLKIRPYPEAEDICRTFDFSNPDNLIFVRGIPSIVTNPELKSFFERFGNVEAALAIRPAKKDRSKFYGYVQFETRFQFQAFKKAELIIKGYALTVLPLTQLPNFLLNKGVKLGPSLTNAYPIIESEASMINLPRFNIPAKMKKKFVEPFVEKFDHSLSNVMIRRSAKEANRNKIEDKLRNLKETVMKTTIKHSNF